MNEVEVVARAVAPMMEGGREFDQMPPTRLELRQWSRSGMCSTNDATQDDATELAQAAIAALDAARGKAEPVAWMYRHPDDPFPPSIRATRHEGCDFIAMSRRGWVETPLYAHPPAPDAARGDPVARVVEFIREQQANAHRHMLEAAHRTTASHFAAAFVTLRNLADAIERGEPFNAAPDT